jgi:hypothetical protein
MIELHRVPQRNRTAILSSLNLFASTGKVWIDAWLKEFLEHSVLASGG